MEITRDDFLRLARVCMEQASVTTTPSAAVRLVQLAKDYLARADRLERFGGIPIPVATTKPVAATKGPRCWAEAFVFRPAEKLRIH